MNDCIDRFRQLEPGMVRKSQPRDRQVTAYHAHPGIEDLCGVEVVKSGRLEGSYYSFACRRWIGCPHENGIGRTGLVKQAAEKKGPNKPGASVKKPVLKDPASSGHDVS